MIPPTGLESPYDYELDSAAAAEKEERAMNEERFAEMPRESGDD
jgi:hypothetical protein